MLDSCQSSSGSKVHLEWPGPIIWFSLLPFTEATNLRYIYDTDVWVIATGYRGLSQFPYINISMAQQQLIKDDATMRCCDNRN